jgi:hypothetical protein
MKAESRLAALWSLVAHLLPIVAAIAMAASFVLLRNRDPLDVTSRGSLLKQMAFLMVATIIPAIFVVIRRSTAYACVVVASATVFFVFYLAKTYWILSPDAGSCMDAGLTKIDSIYFTLSTLTSTGLGDIVPVTQLCRSVVSAQMAVGAVLILGVVGLLVARVSR